jgi:hypothetical protein
MRKMFHIFSYQGNEYQSYIEKHELYLTPIIQATQEALRCNLPPVKIVVIKKTKTKNFDEDSGKRNSYLLLVGMYIITATMYISMDALQNIKNKTFI